MVILVFYVSTYYVFINTYRGDKIAPCPERLPFIESVGALNLFLHPSRRLPFQYLHDIGYRVSGCCQETEMDMVVLDIKFNDLPMFPLSNRFEDSSKFILDFVRSQYLAAVLWRPDKMMFQVVKTM